MPLVELSSCEAAAYATGVFIEVCTMFLDFGDILSSQICRLHCKRSQGNVAYTHLNILVQLRQH